MTDNPERLPILLDEEEVAALKRAAKNVVDECVKLGIKTVVADGLSGKPAVRMFLKAWEKLYPDIEKPKSFYPSTDLMEGELEESADFVEKNYPELVKRLDEPVLILGEHIVRGRALKKGRNLLNFIASKKTENQGNYQSKIHVGALFRYAGELMNEVSTTSFLDDVFGTSSSNTFRQMGDSLPEAIVGEETDVLFRPSWAQKRGDLLDDLKGQLFVLVDNPNSDQIEDIRGGLINEMKNLSSNNQKVVEQIYKINPDKIRITPSEESPNQWDITVEDNVDPLFKRMKLVKAPDGPDEVYIVYSKLKKPYRSPFLSDNIIEKRQELRGLNNEIDKIAAELEKPRPSKKQKKIV